MSSCKIDVSGWDPKQLEIEYFFPLVEQIALDLDYTPCQEFAEENRKKILSSSVTSSTLTLSMAGTGLSNLNSTWALADNNHEHFKVLPDGAVGFWAVTPNMSVGRKTKPNYLHRLFTKMILGWGWKDK